MKFIIDIDGTISNGEQSLLRFYNDDLRIGIDPVTIEALTDYAAFFDLPQVKAFCKRVEKPRRIIEASRERAVTRPEIVSRFEIVPGAVEGMWQLAKEGTIYYYTVRKPEVEEITRHWLEQHGFPHPHQVVICRSVLGKLRQLYEREQSSSERFVFIDDRVAQMIDEYNKLASGDYQQMLPQWREIAAFLQTRVTLVAFGVPSIGVHPSLQLATLARWDHLDHIVALSSHSI